MKLPFVETSAEKLLKITTFANEMYRQASVTICSNISPFRPLHLFFAEQVSALKTD